MKEKSVSAKIWKGWQTDNKDVCHRIGSEGVGGLERCDNGMLDFVKKYILLEITRHSW